jgi:hypothetical protein
VNALLGDGLASEKARRPGRHPLCRSTKAAIPKLLVSGDSDPADSSIRGLLGTLHCPSDLSSRKQHTLLTLFSYPVLIFVLHSSTLPFQESPVFICIVHFDFWSPGDWKYPFDFETFLGRFATTEFETKPTLSPWTAKRCNSTRLNHVYIEGPRGHSCSWCWLLGFSDRYVSPHVPRRSCLLSTSRPSRVVALVPAGSFYLVRPLCLN